MSKGGMEAHGTPAVAVYQLPVGEWDDFKETVREARQFASEARDMAKASRDSSMSNAQTIQELVKPALEKVEEHEAAMNRMRGALWVLGGLMTLGLGAIGFVAAHH